MTLFEKYIFICTTVGWLNSYGMSSVLKCLKNSLESSCLGNIHMQTWPIAVDMIFCVISALLMLH